MLPIMKSLNRPAYRFATKSILFVFFAVLLNASTFVNKAEAATDVVQGTVSPGDVSSGESQAFPAGFALSGAGSSGGFNHGSGGSSDVKTFMGTFSYTYPIQVPPGRGGLTPKLMLTYSSSGKNGWLGMGWDLTITSIERSTKFGAPNYDDNDTFIIKFNGSDNTLVEEDSEYRLKSEGMFLRLIKQGDLWVATDKNKTTYYFGETSNSKLDGGFGTFRWCLERTQDANGNEIFYTYYTDNNHNARETTNAKTSS